MSDRQQRNPDRPSFWREQAQLAHAEVKRLQGLVESLTAANRENRVLLDTQGTEVERLRQELHQAKAEWFEEKKRARESDAEVERLRAALEPFIWSTLPIKVDATYTLHVRGSDILQGRRALEGSSDVDDNHTQDALGEEA